MRAALLYQPKTPLRVEDVTEPKIGPEDVLIEAKACGLCHSDLHLIDGVLSPGKWPIVLGHEAAGVVAETGGKGVDFSEGDRIIVLYYFTCGKCYYCKIGLENLCLNLKRFGIDEDGAFAEYARVPASSLIELPEEVSFAQGAVLCCAVGAAYHALKDKGRLRIGETVAIYGTGGLGMNAVQIAKAIGAHVIAVDVVKEKLEFARKLGADIAINAKEEDPVKKIIDLTNGEGVDVAAEFIGLPKTVEQVICSVRKGGRAIIVGFTAEKVRMDTNEIVRREIQVTGSRGQTKRDLVELTQLVKADKLNVDPIITNRITLDEINKGIAMLRTGAPIRVMMEL